MFASSAVTLRASAFGAAVLLIAASAVALGTQSAMADVTPVSTVYKTATDRTTGSTAASPSAREGRSPGRPTPATPSTG